MLTSSNYVELLAPAGSPEALVAAVANGADAVYLGMGAFNARRGAANFDEESLGGWVRFAHLQGVRVYLTANIVVLPSELQAAIDLIDTAWAAGIDAVIVQDLGMLRLIRTLLPHVRVHGSTQIGTMNPDAVRALAGMGVKRVTLARELPLDAIAACADAGLEVESFVHGALCYSYSGQCLMSSLIGQRSANRGLCAQPCRLQYDLLDASGDPVTTPGRHVLSTKDLAGITQLPSLIDAGVSALKIEGRMKSPEYVAIVTSVYRDALDRAIADPGRYEVLPSEWQRLEEAFSRGFTDAYLTGERGSALMSYTRPNNRGVLIGRVADAQGGVARVPLDRALDPADTLQFWTRSGHFTQTAGELRVDDARVTSAPAGSTVSLAVERPVAVGDRVFRVADAALLEAARRTFSAEATEKRTVPAHFAVTLRIGQPLQVSVEAAGSKASATGEIVTPARTKPVAADEVIGHVGRLGGSGYHADSWAIDLDAGAGVGYSQLHAVRREALEQLDEARLAAYADRRRHNPRIPAPASRPRRKGGAPLLVATAWDVATASACVEAGADVTWLRVFPGDGVEHLPDGVRPLFPRVIWPRELDSLAVRIDGGPVLAGELGSLQLAGRSGAVQADWPLNALNHHAVSTLGDLGASLVWLSPELSGRQMAEVAGASDVPVGCVVWGRTEVMVTEQCVLMASGPCGRRCTTCARRKGWWRLRDQKGYEFPVTTDPSGRSHVLNSVTLDLSRALDEVVASGVSAIRCDFADEGPVEAAGIVRAIATITARVAVGTPAPEEALITPATSGHFYRGLK